ncbi:ATP-dependent DNA helicase [Clostridium sp. K25]|uniref:ATP-dependent DNA helicase n=1 Tax=Clostridium botulinum D str. 1873 TaxID=592027 RepID=A0A9P2G7C8_CLOBO|nr:MULTISPECIES: UvrD-helicase domain-containing protein [Clostridium]NFV48037.1 ATP-dependent DNA helicase [Clostridium botulinum]AYF53577.1 ATP-dependent DNA helicase [Clostridium novyi]EES91340.1 ATP-dependent DNA helicase [Clostridium botulinum D str. 1873]KEI07696.1 ATP-dependent DNA helicase [Clostridium sp. K25]MBO3442152.1 AAA family ATPase [Clostridium haemolyticum]
MKNKELEKEIQKELDFEMEKQRVEETVDIIKKEIRNYIDKRTKLTNHLIDARKKAVEEYKDDEDKLIEFFDHEKFVAEESFKAIDRRFKELNILQPSPYFGKVNFVEKEFNEKEDIYIGRFGITDENAYEPIVVDWRAPIASLFYAGKLGEAKYDAPMGEVCVDILEKRQFIIKREQLLGMFDSELDVKDEILQMVLSKKAGEKLKDIIMTIQQEQDNIIRQPREKTLIVDGVAGSGKTTIALHRVAYLLYNYRKILQDKVLILGPNNIFMEYISTVLPSLGEIGVRQQTFKEFALEILELRDVMDFKEYMENVVDKDEDFVKDILFKTSEKYIHELDKFIDVLNKKYFNIEDLYFNKEIIVEKDAIQELFKYYSSMPLFRRSAKIKRILFSKIRDVRDEKIREIEEWYNKSITSLNMEERNLQEGHLSYKRKLKIRETIKNVIQAKKTLSWLDNETCTELYNGFNRNKKLTIDDLAPILYLKIKLEGLKLSDEIKHVVIDEAQDYSLLQFRVIKELTNCSGYTIVGDKNQRLIPFIGEVPMDNMDKVFDNIKEFKLNKSYRSTKEIMEYANKYLIGDRIVPIVRSGKNVVEKEFNNHKEVVKEIDNTIHNLRKEGFDSIAIVCKNLKQAKVIDSLMNKATNVKILDRENIVYNKGEVIIPSYFAKGLEFDAVIMVTNDYTQGLEDKMMYVMATRALHELYVYKIK